MPKALKVTKENLDVVVENAGMLFFHLDALQYDLEDAAKNGWNLYLITDGTAIKKNITFTTFVEPDFRKLWKFKEAEMPSEFVEIERV